MSNVSGYSNHKKIQSGKFTPRNPSKYVGNVSNIIWRSSYERVFMKWCDSNAAILSWGSEETVVPYRSPWDNEIHRYFVDFIITVQTRTGIRKYLIEVKPKKFTLPPIQPKRKSARYVGEVRDYGINQAKWTAATTYAKSIGAEFMVITESDLGLDNSKKTL